MIRAPAHHSLVRAATALAALLFGAAFAGCAGVSTTNSTAQDAPAVHGALPVSRASSSIVQPQPAPGSCHARGSGEFSLPDAHCTPGAISPAVTQANIHSTICRYGYTEKVRPAESVTEAEKKASLAAYGDAKPLHDFEYDHLIPLELGGAPNDPRNLWPEPAASPNPKDHVEARLRQEVCDGRMTLAHAQRAIAANWAQLSPTSRRRPGSS